MKLRYINPQRLKVIIGMFFGTGGIGILLGLQHGELYITTLGTINICLGGFFGWIMLTQEPRARGRRKRWRHGSDGDGGGGGA